MGSDAAVVAQHELWWGSSPENRAAAEAAQAKALAETMTRRCLQPDAHGELCQNATTKWYEGIGWRCRHHRPKHAPPPEQSPRSFPPEPPGATYDPPPNDGRIESIADANAMIAWAIRELALARIPESRSRGVINGANRYIRNINEIEGKERMDRMEKGMRDAGILK